VKLSPLFILLNLALKPQEPKLSLQTWVIFLQSPCRYGLLFFILVFKSMCVWDSSFLTAFIVDIFKILPWLCSQGIGFLYAIPFCIWSVKKQGYISVHEIHVCTGFFNGNKTFVNEKTYGLVGVSV
jgi:hypothetical protein